MNGWPCGQDPGRSPDAINGAVSCATRRGAWVTGFECGVESRGGGPFSLNARGSSPLPSARTQQRDGKERTAPMSWPACRGATGGCGALAGGCSR